MGIHKLLFFHLVFFHTNIFKILQCSEREVVDFESEDYILGYEIKLGSQKIITFDLRVQTKGWLGLGINLNCRMAGGDYFIGGIFPNGSTYFGDYYLDKRSSNARPKVDKISNWVLIEAQEKCQETFMKFSRKLDTCDRDHDIIINNTTICLLWAYGKSDNLNIGYHIDNRGSAQINLLDPTQTHIDYSKY